MHHIIFTSLAKTLTAGSGYGIAATTPDCPRLAMEEVTKLAGYSEIYPASHSSKDQNPVNYFFVKQSGFHILGRLSAAPNDYSGRSNYLGQFYIFGAESLPECGPAKLLKSLPFIDKFEGEARFLPPTSLPIIPKTGPIVCKSWQQWMGNAGWAGAAADQIMSGSQINILYATTCRGQETLNVLAELFTLLPKSFKWQTTFSTHVEGFPKGTATKIRMLQNGDQKTQDFQKLPNLFDLIIMDADERAGNSGRDGFDDAGHIDANTSWCRRVSANSAVDHDEAATVVGGFDETAEARKLAAVVSPLVLGVVLR